MCHKDDIVRYSKHSVLCIVGKLEFGGGFKKKMCYASNTFLYHERNNLVGDFSKHLVPR